MYLVVAPAQEIEISLKEYLVALRADGKAERTIAAYAWHLRRLLVWLSDRGVSSPRQVSRLHLREWCAELYASWQPSTIKQAVGACRSFFGWLKSEGLTEDNAALALKLPKGKMRVQRTVTEDEMMVLLKSCGDGVKRVRDVALLSLLYDSGLRAAEVCRLRLGDLDLDRRELKVIVKGGHLAKGWFGEATEKRLRDWLAVRVAWPGEETVFVSVGGLKPGHELTPDGLRVIIRRLGQGCGLAPLSPHAFRRGFAVNMSAQGVPDNILKDFGRWEDVGMIKTYTRAQQVGALYPQFSPVDQILTR